MEGQVLAAVVKNLKMRVLVPVLLGSSRFTWALSVVAVTSELALDLDSLGLGKLSCCLS